MNPGIDSVSRHIDVDGSDYMKAEAIKKIEHALRCIRAHEPPIWDSAAGSLALALEHIRTLYQIAEKERRSRPKSAAPRAKGGRA